MKVSHKKVWIKTTCAYCGVGCGVEANVDAEKIIKIRGDKTHPANYGKLCSKGLALAETAMAEGRLVEPEIDGEVTDWQTAIEYVAEKFSKVIAKHGQHAVAFYVSGQLLTEDYYVANKLMKGFIGSGNIDTNSRLCMSSSVAGHKRAFGSDTVSGCYEDLESTDLLVITGSNLAWCHPILYQRIKVVKRDRPNLKVVVIDPRRTDTCEIADLHLAIKPGKDIALFNGLLDYLVTNDAIDHDFINYHTDGFQRTLNDVRACASDRFKLATSIGVQHKDLVTFYQWFANTDKTVTIYSQGVNQSSQGTDKVNSLINCHLATGRIGKIGSTPFSVTGQPNAMGGREVGGLANTLAAHMEFFNEQHHKIVSDFWQTKRLATQPGLKAVELFDAVFEGKVKAIWIMGTNPVVSLPDADKVKKALAQCKLVVVSDCIKDTDTTRLANVLLPAQGWGEKSGTVTNSERRISRQKSLTPPLGRALPDWKIICCVAGKMGFADAFNFKSEADVFREYAKLTTSHNNGCRDLDLSGLAELTDEEYADLTPVQWPYRKNVENNDNKRLFADGRFFTQSGRANFVAVRQNIVSALSRDYPFLLNTGRVRDQWHTMTRTGLSARLNSHSPEPFVNINSSDAQSLGIRHRQLVSVTSPKGQITVRAQVSKQQNLGEIFIPMHWGDCYSRQARVNVLIGANLDPISGQPEFKRTQVNIRAFDYQSEAYLISKQKLDMTDFAYWSMQRIIGGYLYRLASEASTKALDEKLREKYRQYQLQSTPIASGQTEAKEFNRQLCFGHGESEKYRWANITKNRVDYCYFVMPDLLNEDLCWLEQLLDTQVDRALETSVYSGRPNETLAQGRIICSCKRIGEKEINEVIEKKQLTKVQEVSQCTGAGTGCGSCLSELQSILDEKILLMI